ncbi:response regulator transcription factor [Luteococcus peritonei]|uniref:Response regulator n=1 Tax=Luteococcus peritonei TaxID=88874 RepID=A0ABW4S078_9ACTN
MQQPVRILVVDDDELVREAYRSFFASRPDIEVVGEAGDGAAATEATDRLRPDVVLMDLQMPVMSGIDATAAIMARHPNACVVVLTTFGTRDHVVPALRAGAAGYLLKDAGAEALLLAIRQALAGEMPLSPSVRRELVRSVTQEPSGPDEGAPSMSERELELLGWLAHGLSNAEIAGRMYLSESSVKQYLGNIGTKLGCSSRTQILVRSIQLRLVDPHALPPLL